VEGGGWRVEGVGCRVEGVEVWNLRSRAQHLGLTKAARARAFPPWLQ